MTLYVTGNHVKSPRCLLLLGTKDGIRQKRTRARELGRIGK